MTDHCSCAEAMDHIDRFVDLELDELQGARIASHLSRCPACDAHANLQKAVKSSVQRSCSNEVVPPEVRSRVIRRVSSTQVEWANGVIISQYFSIDFRTERE